ncbi:RNA-binding protein 43-like [Heptranchias perlo]|uniref:RNA-binding protein 43-like n=1 Tax=Heptranchias perlo TaxID=212740 RepID=UPI00355A8188
MEANWAERTIIVSGFPVGVLSSDVMIDKLTIHFLRPRNGGGEVESVIYPADGFAYVTFEKKEVVDSVLRKEQVLEDKQLAVKYPLKLTQNSADVFTQVSVNLDLTIFNKRLEIKKLERELQSSNKTLQFSRCLDGRLHVEGSFSAIKELRKDLQRRLDELQVIPLQNSVLKSGICASERKLIKPASNDATQMTELQKCAVSLSYGASDALQPGAFEEETTIILDTDIFNYIKFCKEEYEGILWKYDVRAKVINCNDITVIHLEEASERCEPSQLVTAKLGIEMLISQMQRSLVTDKIRLDGGREQNKTLEICKETMQRFPAVLVRFTDEYVTLIGNVNQCNLFKKELEEKVKAVQSVLDPIFIGCSGILTATGHPHHFGQSLGFDAAQRWDVPNTREYSINKNSHSDQYAKSQVDNFQTSYSKNDSYGKWGISHCDVGTLDSGPSSLPASFSMGSSTRQDRQSENTARLASNRHY